MKKNAVVFLLIILMCWYFLLITRHYFNQRPLWIDEVAVFDSIEHMSAKELFTGPLKSAQVFPRVYLVIIQKISKCFDFHLLSLRFLPFVCMILAFMVWLKIAYSEIKNKGLFFTYVFSWAASVKLVYYAAELKQYSLDVFAGSLILYYVCHQSKYLQEKGVFYNTIILMMVSCLGFFSYIGLFLSIIPLYNLIILSIKNKKYLKYLCTFAFLFCLVIPLMYYFDIRHRSVTTVTSVLDDYFISFESGYQFFKTWGSGTRNLLVRWFAETPRILRKVAMPFVIFGFLNMFYLFFANIKKEGWRIESMKTSAFTIYFGFCLLGALRLYPFTMPRTSLVFCPIVLLLIVKAIEQIKKINIYGGSIVHGAYICFLLFMTLGIAGHVFSGDMGSMPFLWKGIIKS